MPRDARETGRPVNVELRLNPKPDSDGSKSPSDNSIRYTVGNRTFRVEAPLRAKVGARLGMWGVGHYLCEQLREMRNKYRDVQVDLDWGYES